MNIIAILIVSPVLCAVGWYTAGFVRHHVLKNIIRAAVITLTVIPIIGGNLSGMAVVPFWYHVWLKFDVFDVMLDIVQLVLWLIGLSVLGNAFYFSGRKSNPQPSPAGDSQPAQRGSRSPEE